MRFIDWFAGIGGFRLGLDRSGHEAVAACGLASFPRADLSAPVWAVSGPGGARTTTQKPKKKKGEPMAKRLPAVGGPGPINDLSAWVQAALFEEAV